MRGLIFANVHKVIKKSFKLQGYSCKITDSTTYSNKIPPFPTKFLQFLQSKFFPIYLIIFYEDKQVWRIFGHFKIKQNLYKYRFFPWINFCEKANSKIFAWINFRESQVNRENKSTWKLILTKTNPLKVYSYGKSMYFRHLNSACLYCWQSRVFFSINEMC